MAGIRLPESGELKMKGKEIRALAQEQQEYMVALRRELHRHPEVAGEEAWTSARIAAELEQIGIPYVVDERRSIIARIAGGRPGKKLALRADIDALPMAEATGLPYASEIPGVMHACGHDAHAAVLLGAARLLWPLRSQLAGEVFLCFQIGEELGYGAPEIIRYLKEQGGVDFVAGIHLMPDWEPGTFICQSGPLMAGVNGWEITVTGKGGHGSAPWNTVDPIRPAAEILLRLGAVQGTRRSAFEQFVISPCIFSAGTARNIIPDTALISGTNRFFSSEQKTQLSELMNQTAQNIAASYGAQAELVEGPPTMAVVNDPDAAALAAWVVRQIGGAVQQATPLLASDNMGDYLQAFPGIYVFAGSAPWEGERLPIHNAGYSPNEDALSWSAAFFTALAFAVCGRGLETEE